MVRRDWSKNFSKSSALCASGESFAYRLLALAAEIDAPRVDVVHAALDGTAYHWRGLVEVYVSVLHRQAQHPEAQRRYVHPRAPHRAVLHLRIIVEDVFRQLLPFRLPYGFLRDGFRTCRRSVPVLHIRRDVDDIARKHLHGRLAFFLIPAPAGYADQHLPAAFRGVVNVPVVAASRLEGDIVERYLFLGYRSQIAVADEILRVCGVRFADGEYHFLLECLPAVRCGRLCNLFLCHNSLNIGHCCH